MAKKTEKHELGELISRKKDGTLVYSCKTCGRLHSVKAHRVARA